MSFFGIYLFYDIQNITKKYREVFPNNGSIYATLEKYRIRIVRLKKTNSYRHYHIILIFLIIYDLKGAIIAINKNHFNKNNVG